MKLLITFFSFEKQSIQKNLLCVQTKIRCCNQLSLEMTSKILQRFVYVWQCAAL